MGKRGAVADAGRDGKRNRDNAIDVKQMGKFEPRAELLRQETVRAILQKERNTA